MEDEIIDMAMYGSYKAQRDEWFDPKVCSPKMLMLVKGIYGDLEEFERRYLNEKNSN